MFIETLMFDTFISDDSVWEKIKRNVASIYRDRDPRRRFNTRKEAARQFFNFCESKTETLVENARRAGLPRPWHTNPLTKIKQAFRNDLFRATRSAKRVFKPQNGWRANGGR